MIDVYTYSKRGVSKKKIAQYKVNDSLSWIRCIKPKKADLEPVSKKTGIPLTALTKSTSRSLRPGASTSKNYSKIIFTLPEKRKNTYTTTPITIFLAKKDVISVSENSLSLTKALTTKPFHFELNSSSFVYALLQEIIESYFGVFEELEDSIEKLEKRTFDGSSENLAKKVFTLKKTLIYFRKALVANREAISRIQKGYLKEMNKKLIPRFNDLSNELNHLIDLESTYFDILTGTLDMYVGLLNNNSNNVVKTLTVIASFVLVPTLISGIYGMNFKYMPEIHTFLGEKFGYFFSLFLMAFSVVILYIYFKHKEYL